MTTSSTLRAGSEAGALTRQQVLDLARAAHQAPSIHNTQPWRLAATADGLDVQEDPGRGLTRTDPYGRERLISCGAALRNAEITLSRLGHEPITALLPDGPDGCRLATLRAGRARPSSPAVDDLYRAIWARRTHRRIFLSARPTEDLVPVLTAAVAPFRTRLGVLRPARRARFAQIVWSAAQHQVHDEDVRRELAEWTRTDRATDGVPVRSQGTGPFPVDGLLVRTPPVTQTPPPWVLDDLANGTVAVLVAPRDGRLEWLQTGRALENLLLTLTAAGLVASFLNQAVQQEEFRAELADVVDEPGAPQLVLRIGEPLVTVPPTPRRPLGEVLSG
jgi:nitroreductase